MTNVKPARKPAAKKTKVRRISASDIASQMLKLIDKGVYHPGDRLIEQEIADRFEVSRGPVREALRVLEANGVVRIEPMRGATIVRLGDDETTDAVQISALLFGLAARRAAERAGKKECDAIARAASKVDEAADADITPRDFFLQTLEACRFIIDAAKSRRIATEWMQIRAGAPNIFGPLGFATKASRRKAGKKWVQMAEAIAEGEAKKAERIAVALHEDACAAAQEFAI